MICIASDHAGYELKEHVKKYLQDRGLEVMDLGTDGSASVDYPLYGRKAGECVARGEADKGIIICGTGRSITTPTSWRWARGSLVPCWRRILSMPF